MYRRPTLWQRIGDLATRLAVQEVSQATQELASSTSGLPVAGFRAWRNASLTLAGTSDQLVPMDVEDFDFANEYDPSSGIFTPKYSGAYLITAGVGLNTAQPDGAQLQLKIFKNSARERYFFFGNVSAPVSPSSPQLNGADLFSATAGDQYDVRVSVITASTHILANTAATWFSGLLVALA